MPEASALRFGRNASAQGRVKRRRRRDFRQIVERAPEAAKLFGARAALSAHGQMMLHSASLGRLGSSIEISDELPFDGSAMCCVHFLANHVTLTSSPYSRRGRR